MPEDNPYASTASGTSPTPQQAATDFTGFGLDERLIRALLALDYKVPTPIQADAIPVALAGTDLIGSAETGTGKTVAFLLPLLHKLLQDDAPGSGTRALILTPTRELCRQVVKHCKQLATFTHLQVNGITGGHDFKYQRSLFRKNPEIIVATPGRLKEHLDKGAADFSDLQVLVLDEADRMLDMGFMDDVLDIAANCNPQRQTLLFSATLDAAVIGRRPSLSGLLQSPTSISLSTPRQAGTLVNQQIVLSDDEKHKNKVLVALVQEQQQKVIVFTNTKARANQLAGWLRYMAIDAGQLHGDMDQEARNEQMNRLRRGRIKLLVATDVAARGLDIEGVELVVNYDLPRSSEDFIHRTGRTGRAGEQGRAISFITSHDWDRMVRLENELSLKFTRLKVPGLEAKFKGPEKLKSSGKKAATSKRRQTAKDEESTTARAKIRHRDSKNIGKRRKPSRANNDETAKTGKWGDGFAPAPVKKPPR